MYTVKTEVESNIKTMIGKCEADEVIKTVVDAAHEAFIRISKLTDEYEWLKENPKIESIEGCLCEILDVLGD